MSEEIAPAPVGGIAEMSALTRACLADTTGETFRALPIKDRRWVALNVVESNPSNHDQGTWGAVDVYELAQAAFDAGIEHPNVRPSLGLSDDMLNFDEWEALQGYARRVAPLARPGSEGSCGTTGCIAGWTTFLAGGTPGLVLDADLGILFSQFSTVTPPPGTLSNSPIWNDTLDSVYIEEWATDLLGLDLDCDCDGEICARAIGLFSGSNTREDLRAMITRLNENHS